VELEGPATIGVVNLGPFGFDPDDSCDWACEFDSHSVTAWVQPVSSSNNGDGGLAGEDIAGEDSGGVGCGCSTRPHRPILWVAVLVAFGLKRRMAPTWA